MATCDHGLEVLRKAAIEFAGPNELKIRVKDTAAGNILNDILVAMGEGGADTSLIYNEVSSVASGVSTLVLTHTCSATLTTWIKSLAYSGDNVSEWELKINSVTIYKGRLFFSNLNGIFKPSVGYKLALSDVIQVYAIHNRPFVGKFNATLEILEK